MAENCLQEEQSLEKQETRERQETSALDGGPQSQSAGVYRSEERQNYGATSLYLSPIFAPLM